MKDDFTTNSHYLIYTFLFRKVGRMYFLNLGKVFATILVGCCGPVLAWLILFAHIIFKEVPCILGIFPVNCCIFPTISSNLIGQWPPITFVALLHTAFLCDDCLDIWDKRWKYWGVSVANWACVHGYSRKRICGIGINSWASFWNFTGEQT